MNVPGARRQVALVPFIEASHQRCSQHGDIGPPKRPAGVARRRQRLAPGAEKQNAQQAVTENVPAFANEEVQLLEAGVIHPKQKMKQRIEKKAGVVRGKYSARLNRNND